MSLCTKKNDNVIALTIINSDTLEAGKITKNSKVWVCQRHKNLKKSHPNALSIPTQRAPESLMKDLESKIIAENLPAYESLKRERTLIYAVESIMSKKLGLAKALFNKDLEFKAVVINAEEGRSYCRNLKKEEKLRMANILVYAKTNKKVKITENCISYQRAKWVSVQGFKKMYKSGRPDVIGMDDADFAENAMCVKMACDFLEHT